MVEPIRTIDRRERADLPEEAMRAVLDGFRASLWTAMPCIVESFNSAQMTISAQPAIQARVRDQYGNFSMVNLPLLVDVPVFFQGAGNFTLTFPIAQGDECLVVFGSRCINSWWYQGGIQPPEEIRFHDLSDGFAFVGFRSLPRAFTVAAHPRLTSNDGSTYVEMSGGGVVTVVAPTEFVVTSPQIVMNASTSIAMNTPAITGDATSSAGTMTFNGSIAATGDVTAGSVSLKNHKHSGVTPGSGNTGAAF
jgi:hypothetical protein